MGQTIAKVAKSLISKKGNYIEVVERLKNGRIKAIHKVAVETLNKTNNSKGGEFLNHVLNANQNTIKSINSMRKEVNGIGNDISGIKNEIVDISKMLKSSKVFDIVNVGLNTVNLGATVIGFMIINKQLDSITEKLDDMKASIKQLNLKNQIDITKDIEKAKTSYTEMLDSEKRKSEFSEEKLYKLVIQLNECIDYLYSIFMMRAAIDQKTILAAINALLPMYANALRRYDTVYYYKHKEAISTGNALHLDHEKWMNTFEKLMDKKFLDEFKDYSFIELESDYRDAEVGSLVEYSLAFDCYTSVKDNITIMELLDSREEYRLFNEEIVEDAKEEFNNRIKELDEDVVALINTEVNTTAQQLALMS